MKIALLIDSLGFGGAQRQMVNLAAELKKCGHDVRLLRYREDNFYLPLLKKSGIEPITVKSRAGIARAVALRKAIRTLKPDAVISFMDSSNLYAAFAAMGKKRFRLLIGERVADETSFAGRRGRLLKGFQGRFADKIVCNSHCAAALWEKHFPQYKEKIETIYNILDIPPLPCEFGEEKKCRILVAARYEPVKNVGGLIRAVKNLSPSEREKTEIHWYGRANVAKDGISEWEKGKKAVEEYGLSECVFLHPATEKIYPLMAKTDFIGLFSFAEGFPNSVIEAMGYQKPVIMSKVSDYSVLVDEKNGFLCDPKDEKSITEALRSALSLSVSEREEMGRCSLEKIRALCSVKAVVAKWETILLNEGGIEK